MRNKKNTNNENPTVGAEFQEAVAKWFKKHYNKNFEMDKKIPIGYSEKKNHRFDIVSDDNTIAIECKCYTWTEAGNVPSAKMGAANEAVFYLSFLPGTCEKYIVMKKSTHEKHNPKEETLAEYYYRINRHLLGGTKVAEFDTNATSESKKLRIIG